MKSTNNRLARRPSFSILMIGVLAVLLPLLALLQYRWIGQVSEAEGERLQATLNLATIRAVRDIHDELEQIVDEFRLRQRGFSQQASLDEFTAPLVESYEDWQATSPNPELLENVYLYNVRSREYRRFDPSTDTLVEDKPAVSSLARWFGDPDDIPPNVLASDTFADGQLWILAAVVPGGRRQFAGPFGPPQENWMLFEIDSDYLWSEMVPAIVEARFDQTDYRVGIQDMVTGKLVYASEPTVTPEIMLEADARQAIGPRPPQRQFRLLGHEFQVAAQHELGSLAEAVATARRRNLGIGFGILTLLGAAGAMIIVWSERVRSVGRLQMEFAAGISHELRTPLATIRTAAHNIAAGIVKTPEEIREYAEIVQSEGRRLSAMVDQSIQFAQTEAGRRHYDLHPVAVDNVIDRAVTIALPSPEEGGNRFEVHMEAGIPPALADETALTHCLVNLLTNAIKFGPPDRAVTINVRYARGANRILLSVHNEGPGIDADELSNLFEPFFRGRKTSHIPGSGLGLSLVRRMMAGQKGRVTVDNIPGKGVTFVLHIPVAPADLPPEPAKASA